MSNYDIKIHTNPDAQAWAKFFIQTKEEKSWRIEGIDEPLMLAWFANAMMAMHDYIKSQRTWVGLADKEIDSFFEDHGWSPSKDYYPVIKAIEAKLKERNT
jgi:hypothetical protein